MSDRDRDCMLCGRSERGHHDFAQRLKNCRCSSWDGADKYPPICKSFKSSRLGWCETCEHDKACHAKAETDSPTTEEIAT